MESVLVDLLTATKECPPPVSPRAIPEPLERLKITPDTVVIVMTPEFETELLPLPSQRGVAVLLAPLTDGFEASVQTLPGGFPPHEIATPSVLAGNVGEPQEVKRLGSGPIFLIPPASKSDETGLVAVELETMTPEPSIKQLKQGSSLRL